MITNFRSEISQPNSYRYFALLGAELCWLVLERRAPSVKQLELILASRAEPLDQGADSDGFHFDL